MRAERLSREQGRKLLEEQTSAGRRKRHKYRAKATVVDGEWFASKLEAKRWTELRLLERHGQIENLARQPRFALWVNGQLICTYVADFTYRQPVKDCVRVIVEDAKGAVLPLYKVKRALFRALYPDLELLEIKA